MRPERSIIHALPIGYAIDGQKGIRDPKAPLGTVDTAFKGLSHFFIAEDIPGPDGADRPVTLQVVQVPFTEPCGDWHAASDTSPAQQGPVSHVHRH